MAELRPDAPAAESAMASPSRPLSTGELGQVSGGAWPTTVNDQVTDAVT